MPSSWPSRGQCSSGAVQNRTRTRRELALALQRTGHGATWVALIALVDDERPNVPPVDPARLTPAEREEAARIASVGEPGGLAALSDAGRDLAVWTAYGWDDGPAAATEEEILTRMLSLNQQRSTGSPL
jgi:hypothetical protein